MGILSWIVVGLIAGWLAGQVMKGGGYGLLGDIIVGVVGGLLGGWIATSLLHIGAGVNGINLESVLVAFVGAVILLFLLRMLGGGRRSILR
ncbi:MAG: GlsB/YeaQ/YmgE family stress response membrane protein [Anaerolineaceae bacterium]|nr:GlsB/YeaQ/YmgE family stress response membrane protein [Anaerolineaceae bacterium]